MLTAVCLDNELPLTANEINDIRVNRLLPHKLEATETTIAQREPKFHFC